MLYGLLLALTLSAIHSPQAAEKAGHMEAGAMTTDKMNHAHGSFAVKVTPQPEGPGEGLASYTLEKTYTGDLEATATGQMLSAGDPKVGNAGYVAIERITGKLKTSAGVPTGSFALMQQGTMVPGAAPQMTVTIVPGSGTGELSGILGSMTITIAAGKHSYSLDYTLPQR